MPICVLAADLRKKCSGRDSEIPIPQKLSETDFRSEIDEKPERASGCSVLVLTRCGERGETAMNLTEKKADKKALGRARLYT